MLVTGYYQPVFSGSKYATPEYSYPLYKIPNDLVVQHNSDDNTKSIGRFSNDQFVPYWTRQQIDEEKRTAGQELVWLKDPMDVFTLHIQGSGLIRFPDNTVKGVHYAHSNGQEYRSIGKYMVDTDRMTLAEASMDTIRNYVTSHPEERSEIFNHNEKYIFFHFTKTRGALGSLGKELIPGRSVAVDKTCLPAGGLGFLVTRQPVIKNNKATNWKPLRRFVLAHDSGSAIRGPGRVDLYWGTGKKAGMAAGRMKEDGALYFLMLKKNIINSL